MNNPVQFVQMMRNPQMLMQNIMSNNEMMNNPIVNNAIQMYQKRDTEGINQLANNIAKEKGVDINQLTQQIKSQFGIN